MADGTENGAGTSPQSDDLTALRAEFARLNGELAANRAETEELKVRLAEAQSDKFASHEDVQTLRDELQSSKQDATAIRAALDDIRAEVKRAGSQPVVEPPAPVPQAEPVASGGGAPAPPLDEATDEPRRDWSPGIGW